MAGVVLDGDLSLSGRTPVSASGGATINGKKIAVHGDRYGQGSKAIGSCSVLLNGKKIILQGDSLTDGDHATSSSTVSVN